MSRFGACSARISGDRHTHTQTDRETYRMTTVTLVAHARRGLMKSTKVQKPSAQTAYCVVHCQCACAEVGHASSALSSRSNARLTTVTLATNVRRGLMKSAKVQNPRRILHCVESCVLCQYPCAEFGYASRCGCNA